MHPKQKQLYTIIPGRLNAIEVNNDLTYALRLYKKQQKESEIILDLYTRKFYDKPSVLKRKKMNLAKYIQSKEN